MVETVIVFVCAVCFVIYVTGLIYLNSKVTLREDAEEGRDRAYTPSPRGPIKIYVTTVGLSMAGFFVLIVAFAILLLLTGELE